MPPATVFLALSVQIKPPLGLAASAALVEVVGAGTAASIDPEINLLRQDKLTQPIKSALIMAVGRSR